VFCRKAFSDDHTARAVIAFLYFYLSDQILQYMQGLNARFAPDNLAFIKQNECWNTLNLIFCSSRPAPINIHFDHFQAIAHPLGELFERGSLLFAWATPIGVKVNQNRGIAFDKFAE
jgi:hypothetical protein